jgi:hypothetical protein
VIAGVVTDAEGKKPDVPKDARAVTHWLVPVGITLNSVALFLGVFTHNDLRGWLTVLKLVLQAAALACFVVFFVRVWRARQRRLRSLAGEDLSAEGT